jgi:hypothetical protein
MLKLLFWWRGYVMLSSYRSFSSWKDIFCLVRNESRKAVDDALISKR